MGHTQTCFFSTNFPIFFYSLIVESVCKSKWKSLRDNYRREYKKTLKHRLINKSAISGWVHFYNLKFLEQVLDRKQIHLQVLHDHSNDKHNEIERSDDDEDDDNYDDDILIGDELEEPETFLETELIENGSDYSREVKPESVSYDYIRQQQQQKWRIQYQNRVKKARCCRHEPGDEIMHFFKSITPYLQTMESTTKLRVRIEIQEIILNELSKKDTDRPINQQTAVIVSDDENDVVEEITVPVRRKTEPKKVVIVPVRVSKRVQLKKQKLKN